MTSVILTLLRVLWVLVRHIPLLCREDPTDTFVDRLKLGEVGGGYLDRVTGYGKHHNKTPGVQLVLVLDHLWTLPVVLNLGAANIKLFNFYRDWSAGLGLDDGNVIFRLKGHYEM